MGIFDSIFGNGNPNQGLAEDQPRQKIQPPMWASNPTQGMSPEEAAIYQLKQRSQSPGAFPQGNPQPTPQPTSWFGTPVGASPLVQQRPNPMQQPGNGVSPIVPPAARVGDNPQVAQATQPQAAAQPAPQAPQRVAPGTTPSGFKWDPLGGWVDAQGHSSNPTGIQTALGLPGSASNPIHPAADAPMYGGASTHPATDGAHKRGFLAGLLTGLGGSLSGGASPPAPQQQPTQLQGSVQVAPQAANVPLPPTRPKDL